MSRTERHATGDKLYWAQKYPSGLSRKWSEDQCRIDCHYCGSSDIDCDLTGDGLMIACLACDNWWTGPVKQVMLQHKSQEVFIKLPKHFDKR